MMNPVATIILDRSISCCDRIGLTPDCCDRSILLLQSIFTIRWITRHIELAHSHSGTSRMYTCTLRSVGRSAFTVPLFSVHERMQKSIGCLFQHADQDQKKRGEAIDGAGERSETVQVLKSLLHRQISSSLSLCVSLCLVCS
jgi:hypothetical protein